MIKNCECFMNFKVMVNLMDIKIWNLDVRNNVISTYRSYIVMNHLSNDDNGVKTVETHYFRIYSNGKCKSYAEIIY